MTDYCAIVIGGGIAGMLAARALSDYCGRVLVLERDALPGKPHALLDSGREAIEALLPGIFDEQGDGGQAIDAALLRERVLALPNLELRTETTCTDLFTREGRVLGVRLRDAKGRHENLSAPLIVDASGRGSRAVKWLQDNGFPAPPERSIAPDQGPGHVRKDFHRIALPEGLVILGDAACALNPGFGRGATVAAQQALAFGDLLAEGRFTSRRFAGIGARLADRAWLVTAIEAARHGQAHPSRVSRVGLLMRLSDRVVAVGTRDPVVHRAHRQVLHLHRSPWSLAHPRILWRLLPRMARGAPRPRRGLRPA